MGRGKPNHVWTIEEDAKLVEILVELKKSGNWHGEGGSGLKKGYQKDLERILEEKLPGHGLQEKPHIASRCKLLKRQYQAVFDVRGIGELSGFGWDDDRKCVTASKDVWDDYLKGRPDCTFMRSKPFPYFDELALVWGKDRANGMNAEAPSDVIEDLDREQNLNENDQEFDEDEDPDVPVTTKSRDVGMSSKPERKRRRSADGLIVSLERMTNELTSHMDKSNEEMSKSVESMLEVDRRNMSNQQNLHEELQKYDMLTNVEKHKVAMTLVRDPGMLNYFFSIDSEDQRESFLMTLLGGN